MTAMCPSAWSSSRFGDFWHVGESFILKYSPLVHGRPRKYISGVRFPSYEALGVPSRFLFVSIKGCKWTSVGKLSREWGGRERNDPPMAWRWPCASPFRMHSALKVCTQDKQNALHVAFSMVNSHISGFVVHGWAFHSGTFFIILPVHGIFPGTTMLRIKSLDKGCNCAVPPLCRSADLDHMKFVCTWPY